MVTLPEIKMVRIWQLIFPLIYHLEPTAMDNAYNINYLQSQPKDFLASGRRQCIFPFMMSGRHLNEALVSQHILTQ